MKVKGQLPHWKDGSGLGLLLRYAMGDIPNHLIIIHMKPTSRAHPSSTVLNHDQPPAPTSDPTWQEFIRPQFLPQLYIMFFLTGECF